MARLVSPTGSSAQLGSPSVTSNTYWGTGIQSAQACGSSAVRAAISDVDVGVAPSGHWVGADMASVLALLLAFISPTGTSPLPGAQTSPALAGNPMRPKLTV